MFHGSHTTCAKMASFNSGSSPPLLDAEKRSMDSFSPANMRFVASLVAIGALRSTLYETALIVASKRSNSGCTNLGFLARSQPTSGKGTGYLTRHHRRDNSRWVNIV